MQQYTPAVRQRKEVISDAILQNLQAINHWLVILQTWVALKKHTDIFFNNYIARIEFIIYLTLH